MTKRIFDRFLYAAAAAVAIHNAGDIVDITVDAITHGMNTNDGLYEVMETDLGLTFSKQYTEAFTLGLMGGTRHTTHTVYPEHGIDCTSTSGKRQKFFIFTSDATPTNSCSSLSADLDLSTAFHRRLISNYAVNHTTLTGEEVPPFKILDNDTGISYESTYCGQIRSLDLTY
ncbi:MAG: hypothetical protein HRT94_03855 [Alphaproteobacteria bacterium]|nr:hypothetical protein [Alphaproteobacteria bacterium]